MMYYLDEGEGLFQPNEYEEAGSYCEHADTTPEATKTQENFRAC